MSRIQKPSVFCEFAVVIFGGRFDRFWSPKGVSVVARTLYLQLQPVFGRRIGALH